MRTPPIKNNQTVTISKHLYDYLIKSTLECFQSIDGDLVENIMRVIPLEMFENKKLQTLDYFNKLFAYYEDIPEDFLIKYFDIYSEYPFCIKNLCKYQRLSESFMTKYSHSLSWLVISKYQELDESFILKYLDMIDFDMILSNKNIELPISFLIETNIINKDNYCLLLVNTNYKLTINDIVDLQKHIGDSFDFEFLFSNQKHFTDEFIDKFIVEINKYYLWESIITYHPKVSVSKLIEHYESINNCCSVFTMLRCRKLPIEFLVF